MKPRTGLPADLGPGPFSVGSALDRGVGAHRLGNPGLSRPFWGVRSLVEPGNVHDLAAAYLARRSARHVISHGSAATLWGIPLPSRFERDENLHVSVPPELTRPRCSGVTGHRSQLRASEVTVLDGIQVTSQARTWFDLAPALTDEELVGIGDFLRWRRRPFSLRLSRVDLDLALASFSGRRGLAAINWALPLLSDRSDSPPESYLRMRLASAGLPPTEVNPEIFSPGGTFLAMVDLAWPRQMMAVDYEGDHHRTDSRQWEKDISRVPNLQDAGWHHTRVSKADLRSSSALLDRLDRLLRERGWQG